MEVRDARLTCKEGRQEERKDGRTEGQKEEMKGSDGSKRWK